MAILPVSEAFVFVVLENAMNTREAGKIVRYSETSSRERTAGLAFRPPRPAVPPRLIRDSSERFLDGDTAFFWRRFIRVL